MKGNGCAPAIRVSKLLVRPSLANLDKTQVFQRPNDLFGLERR
jgi:hypothetical protein